MVEYQVVYQKVYLNWGAYVPQIPGCAVLAETREQAEMAITLAIQLHSFANRSVPAMCLVSRQNPTEA